MVVIQVCRHVVGGVCCCIDSIGVSCLLSHQFCGVAKGMATIYVGWGTGGLGIFHEPALPFRRSCCHGHVQRAATQLPISMLWLGIAKRQCLTFIGSAHWAGCQAMRQLNRHVNGILAYPKMRPCLRVRLGCTWQRPVHSQPQCTVCQNKAPDWPVAAGSCCVAAHASMAVS